MQARSSSDRQTNASAGSFATLLLGPILICMVLAPLWLVSVIHVFEPATGAWVRRSAIRPAPRPFDEAAWKRAGSTVARVRMLSALNSALARSSNPQAIISRLGPFSEPPRSSWLDVGTWWFCSAGEIWLYVGYSERGTLKEFKPMCSPK